MQFLEIFSLIAGLVYICLQVKQNNWMWLVNILSCTAAAIVFIDGKLWANAGINVYYCLMSLWGIYVWLHDSRKVEEGEMHLRKLPKGIALIGGGIILAGGFTLIQGLRVLGDPAPVLDGICGILGIVGTWWLAQSYLENWMIWIVGDLLGAVLCISQGLWWMAALYAVYVAVAFLGFREWKEKGRIVN